MRTKSEIVYKSDGTKIETIDADGNRVEDYGGVGANSDFNFL